MKQTVFNYLDEENKRLEVTFIVLTFVSWTPAEFKSNIAPKRVFLSAVELLLSIF